MKQVMRWLSGAWIGAATLLLGCGPSQGDAVARGQNVLLITMDTTRADHLGCQGGPEGITPHLDALAARSSHFLHAVSETNVTNPSHLTIMTGLRALDHGIVNNVRPLPEGLDTLPVALQRAGYRTGGFPAVPHVGEEFHWTGFDTFAPAGGVVDAHVITDRVLEFIDAADSGPFFAWAHYFDPHSPYEPPRVVSRRFYSGDATQGDGPLLATLEGVATNETLRKWLDQTRDPAYPLAMYAAEVAFMDREIGRLLAGLEERGLHEKTIVVAVADHGESLGEHGVYYSHNGVYEPQLRIPFIIHVPGHPPDQHSQTVTTLDVTPTLHELLGAGPGHAYAGMSLASLVTDHGAGAELTTRTVVHQSAHNRAIAVREGPWKLIWPIQAFPPAIPEAPQLFELAADPMELQNLAVQNPTRVEELRTGLDPWIDLGFIHPDEEMKHLEPAALERLRALGYVN